MDEGTHGAEVRMDLSPHGGVDSIEGCGDIVV